MIYIEQVYFIMKTLFYSTKDFELPYLKAAGKDNAEVVFINEALGMATAAMAKGYDAISIFAGDDASAKVLEMLYNNGVAYIAIRSAGYDNVDIKVAAALGIIVANVPEYSPYAIAEHAATLIMALNRKIITADKQIHQQNFTTGNLVGFDLNNKKVGIIGVGRIGSVMAKIMHGFGCKLLGFDLNENAEVKEKYGLKYVNLVTLCLEADIISIHLGLTPQTKYLVNKKLINLMRPGVMLINTGRGGCVNTTDVIEGLEKGQIGYYGADVYEKEKGLFFYDHTGEELKDETLSKLLAMPNVLLTPHQAFATQEALTNIATTTFYNLDRWSRRQYSKNELSIN